MRVRVRVNYFNNSVRSIKLIRLGDKAQLTLLSDAQREPSDEREIREDIIKADETLIGFYCSTKKLRIISDFGFIVRKVVKN